ncbi:MAG: ABC transporter permease [Oscillospiraceae bacterium]|jgi:putative ABC transport system permease protein|nr:ABC transporter permease [Oscillospiraceae bacterium]
MIIQNALKSITRCTGRNILIGIIVLVISVASCVALNIKNAAAQAETEGLSNIKITGQISLDRQKMMESFNPEDAASGERNPENFRDMFAENTELSLDQLQTYASSGNVEDFYYISTAALNAADDIEPFSESSSEEASEDTAEAETNNPFAEGMPNGGMPGGQNGGMMQMNQGDFTLTAVASESALTDFINGTSKISSGTIFDVSTADNNCIISSELAAFNGDLAAGDTITLANPSDETETYTLNIVGIYTNTSSTSDSNGMGMRFSTALDPANNIYLSASSLTAIAANSESVGTTSTDDYGRTTSTAITTQTQGTYVFADVDSYNAFGTELTSLGLDENYTLTSNDISSYEASLVPLQNLSSFATTMLLIVLAVGAVILIVINIFSIQQRKYEVGVLTAIGIKKWKVAAQFVTELLCVTLVAVIVGAAISAAVSVPVANTLLANQISSQQTQQQSVNDNFGRGQAPAGMPNAAPNNGGGNPMMGGRGDMFNVLQNADANFVDKINAVTDFYTVLQIILIGVVLTIISSIVAIIFIARYEPLKILANRT